MMVLMYIMNVTRTHYPIEYSQEFTLSRFVENVNDYSDIILHSHPVSFYHYGDYHRE